MPGLLPVMSQAVSTRHGTLIDREGKWLLAGALIVSFTSDRIGVTVERCFFVFFNRPSATSMHQAFEEVFAQNKTIRSVNSQI